AYENINIAVKLVMAGGSSYTDDYMVKLRTHESDRVRLLDWVSGERLEELLTNAMLFVLPSDLEGLSLALLEAMGAGICTLASDIPENREVIGDAGFTFVPGDVTDLERMLRLLIEDPQIREITGLRARERVREFYQWDSVATEVQEIYLRLMRSSPSTGKRLHSAPLGRASLRYRCCSLARSSKWPDGGRPCCNGGVHLLALIRRAIEFPLF